jgi:ubiquitin carboxyl-terminal hydrolase 7
MNVDDILYEEGGIDDDLSLGLDHVDRTRSIRNGQEMFLK